MKGELTREEMRKAIARDVIAQVEVAKYVARPMTYVSKDVDDDDGWADRSIAPAVAATNAERCNVCALGALVLSQLRLFNEASRAMRTQAGADRDPIIKQLRGYFTESELRRIENTFESFDTADWLNNVPRWEGADVRLVCIMDNIARNGFFNESEAPRVQLVRQALRDYVHHESAVSV